MPAEEASRRRGEEEGLRSRARAGSALRLRHRSGVLFRHRQGEAGALADGALQPEVTTEQVRQPLGDRQAEPGAAALAPYLLELLEDPLAILRGDARAGVAHEYLVHAIRLPHLHLDDPVRGELHRV